MSYTYSSAIASFCWKTGLETAMALVKNAGYDSLDFPFSVYSAGFQPPMLREDWKSWVRSVLELSRRYDLPITQSHAAWLQDIPSDFKYSSPSDLYHRSIEAASILGCKHVVFHPVRLRERIESQAIRDRIHDWNVRWFHELIRTAENCDVYINLENTFDSHNYQKVGDPPYPYTVAEDMLRLLRELDSDRVRLCLDTGHANNSEQDIPAMIRAFRSDLATVHLNDNFGRRGKEFADLHLFPGRGMIRWESILSALKDIRFRGVMNIEPIDALPDAGDLERRELLASGKIALEKMLSQL